MPKAAVCILVAIALLLGARPSIGASTDDAPVAALESFGDEAHLQAYFERLIGERRKVQEAAKAALEAYRKAQLSRSIAGKTTPGAAVVVENAGTGYRREITADAVGDYQLGSLPNGIYTVSINGKSRTVEVATKPALDTVTVAGSAVNAIDVASVESSSILTQEQIANIPIPDDITSVALLAPGTVAGDVITNVQTAGVDEGGIVKKAGDFLVVLRRGRLFSIRASESTLQPVSSAHAYGPHDLGDDAWYDEMLISGRTIVVIGFSYAHKGTEVGLFDLSPDGRITYRATYHLASNDYYSSRNYASRLVGNTLIFYSPLDLFSWNSLTPNLPGVRRWKNGKEPFQRIAAAEHVYRSRIAEDSVDQTLHTVTRCEIGDGEMDCRSTSVIGPRGSAFYVSRNAVYVWMVRYFEDAAYGESEEAGVVRMPLDGSVPAALRVQGSPIDQMSFLEQDGYLNVLVGAESKGLRMWAAEGKSGGLALLRVPVTAFGDAQTWSRPEHYRALPSGPSDDGYWSVHDRYIGSWLLYGGEEPENGSAVAVRIDDSSAPALLKLGHGVERIEAMGRDALIVGSVKGDLLMSSVALGTNAALSSRMVLPGFSQGEERSHGFFYRPLAARQGLFGLPVLKGTFRKQSASVHFVRNANLMLGGVGSLTATTKVGQGDDEDGCVASCVDWYGNARPIFVGERIYGLLGYELIEGAVADGRVREHRRVNFMPTPARSQP
jgi:hypothetical protein